MFILTFAGILTISYYSGYTPAALGVLFVFASTITYLTYAKDKAAAKSGSWRVSEKTLHMESFLFGWPGALIAQQRLRHKTQKRRFRAVFWLSVLLNLAGIAWLHSPQGHALLRESAHQIDNVVISHVPYEIPVSTVLFLTKFRGKNIEWLR